MALEHYFGIRRAVRLHSRCRRLPVTLWQDHQGEAEVAAGPPQCGVQATAQWGTEFCGAGDGGKSRREVFRVLE